MVEGAQPIGDQRRPRRVEGGQAEEKAEPAYLTEIRAGADFDSLGRPIGEVYAAFAPEPEVSEATAALSEVRGQLADGDPAVREAVRRYDEREETLYLHKEDIAAVFRTYGRKVLT